jgi:hypothetical protein
MRRRTGKWPQGDPVLHPVLTHFLLKAADFITVHRAGKQFPECVPASACPQSFQQGRQGGCMRNLHKIRSKVSDSGGNRNFYYAYFILFWNAEMKRNKQSKINLFLTRITICFLTAIGKPLHHNLVCLSLCVFTENPVDFSENRKLLWVYSEGISGASSFARCLCSVIVLRFFSALGDWAIESRNGQV